LVTRKYLTRCILPHNKLVQSVVLYQNRGGWTEPYVLSDVFVCQAAIKLLQESNHRENKLGGFVYL